MVLRPKLKSFILDTYMLKLYEAIDDFELPLLYKVSILTKYAGVVTKLIYAFLF